MTTSAGFSRPATSADVAVHAGVSRSTVSNILNGHDARYPESTRQRVRDAAAHLDYRPSLAGRSLVSGRSDTIVVLLPNTTFGSNLQDAVDQVMVGMNPMGGNVVVRFAGATPEATLSAVLALRPLGVVDLGVLSAADRDDLERRGILTVPRMPGDVGPANDGGIAALQAGALLQRGRRPLWFAALRDQRLDPYGAVRFAALRDVCAAERLPPPRRVDVPLVLTGAVEALADVMSVRGSVGLACYNDDVALAVLAAARELGLVVPNDLAVVGVDHTPIGQLWSPALTTVDVDLRGLVDELAADLRLRLGGDAAEPVGGQAVRHFTLVLGGTT